MIMMMKEERCFWLPDDGGGAGFGVGDGGGGEAGSLAGSAAAAGTESTVVGADGVFGEGWTSRLLPEELGDARTGFGKFRSVGELGAAYHSLQKRLGKGASAVYVPGEGATAAEVSAYRQAMGVPETAAGYQIKPENLPEGVSWDDAAVAPVLEIAHKYNAPEALLKDLAAWDLEREQAREAAAIEVHNAEVKKAADGLRQLWGESFQSKIARVEQMAKLTGIDARSPGFADPEVVKAFARFSELISDDKFHGGDAVRALSGEAAAKDIQTNPGNPLYARYQDGDPDTVERVRALRRGR